MQGAAQRGQIPARDPLLVEALRRPGIRPRPQPGLRDASLLRKPQHLGDVGGAHAEEASGVLLRDILRRLAVHRLAERIRVGGEQPLHGDGVADQRREVQRALVDVVLRVGVYAKAEQRIQSVPRADGGGDVRGVLAQGVLRRVAVDRQARRQADRLHGLHVVGDRRVAHQDPRRHPPQLLGQAVAIALELPGVGGACRPRRVQRASVALVLARAILDAHLAQLLGDLSADHAEDAVAVRERRQARHGALRTCDVHALAHPARQVQGHHPPQTPHMLGIRIEDAHKRLALA
mmetsp:Transcript_24313/g.73032  ORF Transcript_24313/g.73032 Transcript_24313/m.73032 type:complete len:291 (+) Transcript_24313:169-1041(+)